MTNIYETLSLLLVKGKPTATMLNLKSKLDISTWFVNYYLGGFYLSFYIFVEEWNIAIMYSLKTIKPGCCSIGNNPKKMFKK